MGKRIGANSYRGSWHGLDDSWMDEGACLPLGPAEKAVFFMDEVRGVKGDAARLAAKQVCWDCPVQAECLDYALKAGMQGIWGGTTERERRRILKARRATAV